MYPGLSYNSDNLLSFSNHDISALAKKYGTPLYVYSADLFQEKIRILKESIEKYLDNSYLICYSAKANSNLSILSKMNQVNCGADVVSGGELYRAKQAGIPSEKIIFAGSGKTREEIQKALEANILLFSVESEGELILINEVAQENSFLARVSLRVNPAVDANSHSYISTGREHDKFGIPSTDLISLYKRYKDLEGIAFRGLSFHIGSQITDVDIFANASQIISKLGQELQSLGYPLEYIDVGGGLGVDYQNKNIDLSVESYIQNIALSISLLGEAKKDIQIILEPGRFVMANAGILISQILYEKRNSLKKFYIANVAINDLVRPSYYEAHHEILAHRKEAQENLGEKADFVGPICESGDFMARDRHLPSFQAGDYAVICGAGAYGFSMASNYNSRCRPAEVLLEKDRAILIRRRESYEDLVALEKNAN